MKAGEGQKFYFCKRGNDVCISTGRPFLPHGENCTEIKSNKKNSFAYLEYHSLGGSAHFYLCSVPGSYSQRGVPEDIMNKVNVFAATVAHSRLSLLFTSFQRQDVNAIFLFVQYVIAQVQTQFVYSPNG